MVRLLFSYSTSKKAEFLLEKPSLHLRGLHEKFYEASSKASSTFRTFVLNFFDQQGHNVNHGRELIRALESLEYFRSEQGQIRTNHPTKLSQEIVSSG